MKIEDFNELLTPRFTQASTRLPDELEKPLKALEDLAGRDRATLVAEPMSATSATLELRYATCTARMEVEVTGRICGQDIPETHDTPAEYPWVEDLRVTCGETDLTDALPIFILEALEADLLGESL